MVIRWLLKMTIFFYEKYSFGNQDRILPLDYSSRNFPILSHICSLYVCSILVVSASQAMLRRLKVISTEPGSSGSGLEPDLSSFLFLFAAFVEISSSYLASEFILGTLL